MFLNGEYGVKTVVGSYYIKPVFGKTVFQNIDDERFIVYSENLGL